MESFLSCDWGTSSLRLGLIKEAKDEPAVQETSEQGIGPTYEAWKATGQKEERRSSFYTDVIRQHIHRLEQRIGINMDSIPLVLSGMASSSIGIAALPYGDLPFKLDGEGLVYRFLEKTDHFRHDILLISGVKSKDDVMRGEETQLIGSASIYGTDADAHYIFPGTHSKHIHVTEGRAIAFASFMTGELFQLLQEKSILRFSIEREGSLEDTKNKRSFVKGVRDSLNENFLHQLFTIRSSNLLGNATTIENYYYLSGLLIGTELNKLSPAENDPIILCCSGPLKDFYLAAFDALEFSAARLSDVSMERAVAEGQRLIYNTFNKNKRHVFLG